MIHWLYNSALTIISPLAAAYLALHPRHRPLLRRFAPNTPSTHSKPVWVHACSLGEVNTALPLLKSLRHTYPHTPIVLTVSTQSGMDHAQNLASDFNPTWFPFDLTASVKLFLKRLQPRLLILIETELWPNVLRQCHQQTIPVALVNGRISQKHFRRYQLQRPLLAPLLATIQVASMQSRTDQQRIEALGIPPEHTVVTGNIKFDGVPDIPSNNDLKAWRNELGIPLDADVVTFGSTRPGDESLAAACIKTLRADYPDVRWIIAPRHNKRIQDALAPFEGMPIVLRSQILSGQDTATDESILMLDTLGELQSCYAISCIAVIGGSFFPGVEGHNPIESAAMGVTTLFGPYMGNFTAVSESLLQAEGAIRVESSQDLCSELSSLLGDNGRREYIGGNGRLAVLENQGALSKTMEALRPWLT